MVLFSNCHTYFFSIAFSLIYGKSIEVNQELPSDHLRTNIIAGIPTQRINFYAKVTTKYPKYGFCGGAVINNFMVLTAASCAANVTGTYLLKLSNQNC